MPDVKSITEKELDQKLREAHVEPQQVDPIGSNTIPPYYSREVSRYEPPIPVQEKEKQEALEMVKEIANGWSKGSKSVKPVEGDTDLSWDHEGLEPHPKPGEPKPPRDPRPPRTPKTETKEEQSSTKVCPKCKGNHDERDYTKFIFKKEKQGSVSPQPIESNPQVDKSETKVKEKWNHMERNNNVDIDTEKWVEEQNTFLEKKREKQSDEIPARFDPKGPVTILQRRHYASVPVSGQVPQSLKDSKYTQSQPNDGMAGYEGTWYRREFGAGHNPKGRKWPQGNGYWKRYGTKEKKGTGKSYRQNGTQSQTYYTTQELRRNGQYLPMKDTSNRQDGNRGDEGKDDKTKFRNSKYDFEDKKDEENDTEDSCELEVTPEQLSWVVSGGGVLKIKLSKKKPIKIKAGVPNGEPDPAQTKVKTIHDSTNRRDRQPISNQKSGVVVGVGQSVENKIPLGGIKQPMLRTSKEERSNIPSERMGRHNDNDNGASDKNGDSHDHGNSTNENGGPGGNRDPPDRRGERPPRGNENPDGGDAGSDPDDSWDGDDSSSSTDSTPPRRRGHRKPKYVYVLQGPPGPPGQEGQPG